MPAVIHGLHVVLLRIPDESAVVPRVILGPERGSVLLAATMFHGGLEERVHRFTALCDEGHVCLGRGRLVPLADGEVVRLLQAERHAGVIAVHHAEAQRRESSLVEAPRRRKISHHEEHVVHHDPSNRHVPPLL
jgi:hypothetical protein